jgi:phytoene dehydrogenase-like protein
VLDYDALNLRPFYPGALIRYHGHFYRFADPWRHPIDGMMGLFSPIGSFSDKFRVRKLRQQVLSGSLQDLYQRTETTTLQSLRNIGFSENMIDGFFRPFIGGVFFDPTLGVSSRMFEFGFRMFSMGDTALPSGGMGAIPEQILSRLPEGSVRTEARVKSIQEEEVILHLGESIKARAVVVATEGPEAARILGGQERQGSRSVTCVYFAADEPPFSGPLLVLNGEGKGFINSLCFPSHVAPSYAPKGKTLASVTLMGIPDQSDQQLETVVRAQLTEWFGTSAKDWRRLRTYRIPHALPMQVPPVSNPVSRAAQIRPGLFVCGEYQNVASIQWAMVSGHNAAEAVIDWLRK